MRANSCCVEKVQITALEQVQVEKVHLLNLRNSHFNVIP